MPTFDDPAAGAVEAQQALQGLAHALRQMDDPTPGYKVLGSLTWGMAFLDHALQQLAEAAKALAEDRAAYKAAAKAKAAAIAAERRAPVVLPRSGEPGPANAATGRSTPHDDWRCA